MRDSLGQTVDNVVRLCSKDPEFKEELRRRMADVPSSGVIPQVELIRRVLGIRAEQSIDYDFIKDEQLRDELIIDNLRMEGAITDLSFEEDYDRFLEFSEYAFFQIEGVIRYFYYTTYVDDNHLESVIKAQTAGPYEYKGNGYKPDGGRVSIDIGFLITAICQQYSTLYPNVRLYRNLKTLRNLRVHRSTTDDDKEEKEDKVISLYQRYSYSDVRQALVLLVDTIRRKMK